MNPTERALIVTGVVQGLGAIGGVAVVLFTEDEVLRKRRYIEIAAAVFLTSIAGAVALGLEDSSRRR